MDDLDCLTQLVSDLEYPEGIQKVTPGRLRRVAFFPGGTGVIDGNELATAKPGRTLPRGGILVLGHNFFNVASYERSVAEGNEVGTNPTWANLAEFFNRCKISLSDCFFSNALLGLIETDSAMGSHSGHRDLDFRLACRNVLQQSILLQQPRLVIALGLNVARFLGEMIPGLENWRDVKTFREFDERFACAGLHLSAPTAPFVVVAIVHPSLRNANVRFRRFSGRTGNEAEVEMVRQANSLSLQRSSQS